MSHILFLILQLVPWYLFPGAAPADTSRTKEFKLDIPETINVSLAMPLDGSVPGNVDFYCGALLAARDLGQEGLYINLHAHDSSLESINAGLIATSDVFIGPVSFDDILSVARTCPSEKAVISPLEQRVSGLTDSLRIVQTPTRVETQKRELARWAAEDLLPETSIAVILENSTDIAGGILDELDKLGVPYTKVIGFSDLTPFCKEGCETRFITGSDKEYFNSGAVRCVSVLALEKQNVSIYCPSRVRNYENLNVELLHNANAHIATNYYVDYDSPEVRTFVYSYRALFKAEPNSFAFHGYDTMKYFTKLCSMFGREWFTKVDEYRSKGLQSDFSFGKAATGAVNHACRRIVYNNDFTISVH